MQLTPMTNEDREYLDSCFESPTVEGIVSLLIAHDNYAGEFKQELSSRSILFLEKNLHDVESYFGLFLAFDNLGAIFRNDSIESLYLYMKNGGEVKTSLYLCRFAELLLKAYRFDESYEYFTKAVKLSPTDSVSRNIFLNWFIKTNKLDEGIEYYTRLLDDEYCVVRPMMLGDFGIPHKNKNGMIIMDTRNRDDVKVNIRRLKDLKESGYVFKPRPRRGV